jgi:hypothetical protein
MNAKLKEDIEIQSKSLRNPNTQKQFKEYYYDKEKTNNPRKTAPTATSLK